MTSVRHPDNARDYAQVERLLSRTLRSMASQAGPAAAIVVVTNREVEVPDGMDVEQVIVDFPAPSALLHAQTGREAVLLDKGTKLAVGTARAKAGYVMFVDADDYVSNRISNFVAERAGEPGWFVDRGWSYDAATGSAVPIADFNKVCGSSLIMRRDLLEAPDLPPSFTQADVVRITGAEALEHRFGSHRYLADHLGLAPLPFPAALYSVGTGENHSGKTQVRLGRPLSRRLRHEFSVDSPSTPSAWAQWTRRAARSTPNRLHRFASTARIS